VVTCTGSLPVDGTESCTGPGQAGFPWSGVAANEQSIYGMTLDLAAAHSVHVTITRDGTTILDEIL
jgi:hypothetical protein